MLASISEILSFAALALFPAWRRRSHLRTTKQANFDSARLDTVSKKGVDYRNQREGVQEIIQVRVIAIKSTAWSGYSPLSGFYRMQGLARGIPRCLLGLPKSFKVYKRSLSDATAPSSSGQQTIGENDAPPPSRPSKFEAKRPEGGADQVKKKSRKRSPVAWPQRPDQDPAEMTAHLHKTAIEYPYFVPRNSNGCVPVYSDFKNNRTREITLIRNVEGNVHVRPVFVPVLPESLMM